MKFAACENVRVVSIAGRAFPVMAPDALLTTNQLVLTRTFSYFSSRGRQQT